jgi:hypothetical protein
VGGRRCALTARGYPGLVKVAVYRGGGLAGLVQKTAVNEESLTPEQAGELRAKLDELGVMSERPALQSSPRQPDRFSYAVHIQDEDGERTVQASEPDVPKSVLELTSYLKSLPGVRDEIVPVGELPRE